MRDQEGYELSFPGEIIIDGTEIGGDIVGDTKQPNIGGRETWMGRIIWKKRRGVLRQMRGFQNLRQRLRSVIGGRPVFIRVERKSNTRGIE